MKPWMKHATSASDAEVERMNPALPESVNAGVREDSASTDEEIAALMRRLHRTELAPARSGLPLLWPALLGGGLLMAGAAAAAVTAMTVGPALLAEPVPTAQGSLALSGDASHTLTESIEVSGLGELRVDRVHETGAEVSLVRGVARFDVDPAGSARELSVSAGDVDIEVFGTVFSVHRLGEQVEVKVERGEVGVRWNGESFSVVTGESWRRGEGIVAAASAASPGSMDTPEVGAIAVADAGSADDDGAVSEASPPREARPSAVAPVRVDAGSADDAEGDVASVEPDPCVVDSFSPACARSRLRNAASSPESRYAAMKGARGKAAYNADTARTLVDNANWFLDQYADSPYADDVRAFRVEGAFYGSRASQTISFADAFLATAPADHQARERVGQWRRIATLRRDVIDAAQRDCAEADPHLAELIRLESGLRKDEARAHRGVCAYQLGQLDKAQEILRTIENEERLPIALKGQVREAWSTMRAPSRDERRR